MNIRYCYCVGFLFLVLVDSVYGQHVKPESSHEQLVAVERIQASKKLFPNKNLNTGNYDLNYTQLNLEVDPNINWITGEVTAYFTAKETLNTIYFELSANLTVTAVTHAETVASYSQNTNDELIIDLSNTLQEGVLDSITISYNGKPQPVGGFGSFEQTTHNGAGVIWTLSEPYGAKSWWPCKQDLNDKIDSLDVIITVPTGNTAVSNGLLLEEITTGEKTTFHWRHNYPIPAYLIAFATTNYEKYSHTAGSGANTFPIDNYVYPENLESAKNSTEVTVPIMNLYEELFEPYPYHDEKYGHAQFGWGGGMEHTTISFMGGFSRDLIAHELAHQWFGDKITCGSWQDIWLNESFATYLAALVIEEQDGEAAFKNWRAGRVNNITGSTSGSVYIPVTDTLDVNRVFSSRLSYNKGAMVLHMLRKKMGEDAFFSGLKNYLKDPDLAYGYAHTEDLQKHLEAFYNQSLTEFFQDWIYGEGYPGYDILWEQQEDQLHITLNQTTSNASVDFFEGEVYIQLITTQDETLDITLDMVENNQTFTLDLDNNTEIKEVLFDPESHLISRNSTVTLGMKNQALAAIGYYPNPVADILNIQLPAEVKVEKIELFTLEGKQIKIPFLKLENRTSPIKVSVAGLNPGIYFLRLSGANGIITKKIIKK